MPFDADALTARLREFAAARDWEQFHTPKNLATALVVEAGELVEIFQWLTPEESAPERWDAETRRHVEEEVADVLIYLLRFADVAGLDIGAAVTAKIDRNEGRFPAK